MWILCAINNIGNIKSESYNQNLALGKLTVTLNLVSASTSATLTPSVVGTVMNIAVESKESLYFDLESNTLKRCATKIATLSPSSKTIKYTVHRPSTISKDICANLVGCRAYSYDPDTGKLSVAPDSSSTDILINYNEGSYNQTIALKTRVSISNGIITEIQFVWLYGNSNVNSIGAGTKTVTLNPLITDDITTVVLDGGSIEDIPYTKIIDL